MENATHKVTYKGETRSCTVDNYSDVVDELIEKHGKGAMPQFEPIADSDPGPAPDNSLSGRLRAQADELTALEAGFAPKPPVFAIGTRVNDWGVDNARKSQLEHEQKPAAISVAEDLVRQVQAEQRRDTAPIATGQLRMDKSGRLVLPVMGEPGAGTRHPLTPRAFDAVFGRFDCASGGAYLRSCPTKLRSINFNHWAVHTEQHQPDSQTVLRLRNGEAGREVFASVSPRYTSFDADKIGQALALAFPPEAKGSLDYDGERLRLEGLWHSDVKPEDYVAGEIFKAGVIVRSDDTGSGSIRIQSVLWRNLCLNLIILDQSIGVDIRLRHSGSVGSLARNFRNAFQKALDSVEPFRKAWSRASAERDDRFVQRVQGTTSEDLSQMPPTAVLSGVFNGIMERDLVPLRGRRKDVVPKLLEMHAQDEAAEAYGVSRASVINAFTRYAHQVESDPFAADDIRAGAGKLLSAKAGRVPPPLPYLPIK